MCVSRIKGCFQMNSPNQGSTGEPGRRPSCEDDTSRPTEPYSENSICLTYLKTIKSEEELKKTFFDKVWPGQMEYYYQ